MMINAIDLEIHITSRQMLSFKLQVLKQKIHFKGAQPHHAHDWMLGVSPFKGAVQQPACYRAGGLPSSLGLRSSPHASFSGYLVVFALRKSI